MHLTMTPSAPRQSAADLALAPHWRIAAALLLGIGLCALSSCASVPNVEPVMDQSANADAKPQLSGARGPLTVKQSKAILDKLRTQAPDSDILQRHLVIEEAIAESPLMVGNRTRILHDGTATFSAMFAAIHGARDHINLEYYIVEDVESGGEQLGDLLLAKRAAGVQVNVIYDSYGSNATPDAFFIRLRNGGINVVDFNPVNPLEANAGSSPDNRDHRKILVVDGATAIVGGVNLSATYEAHPLAKSGAIEGKPGEFWRDTDLQIDGPAVAQLQRLFLEHWSAQKGPSLDQANFFPAIPPKGNEVVRTLGSAPKDAVPRYYVTMLSAIRTSEKSISLSTAYFVPTEKEVTDLIDAARRGVEVRLLLPGESDSELALTVGRSNYRELLEAGVKIYETKNEVLHSKAAVIDGVWTIIGSSNFDHRSVIFNDEVDTVVLGRETGQQMDAMFETDFKKATAIDLATWKDRPLSTKIKEVFFGAWQSQL
ncbi:MAG: phospholipase D-like domain-containing protein [Acidobacteriota bacterium]